MDNVVKAETPSGASATSTYDSLGQLTQAQDPNGVITKLGYDYAGRQVRSTDGMGRSSVATYDRVGQLVASKTLDAASASLGSTQLAYDADGNLISSTPASGKRATVYTLRRAWPAHQAGRSGDGDGLDHHRVRVRRRGQPDAVHGRARQLDHLHAELAGTAGEGHRTFDDHPSRCRRPHLDGVVRRGRESGQPPVAGRCAADADLRRRRPLDQGRRNGCGGLHRDS